MSFLDRAAAHAKRIQEQQDYEYARILAGYKPSASNEVGMKADEDLARELYEDEIQQLLEVTRPMDATENDLTDPHSGSKRKRAVDDLSADEEDEPEETDGRLYVQGRAPKDCVSCHDSPGLVAVPCGHRYCAECVTQVIRNAMSDGTAFPPRCCRQEIPVADIRRHLDRDFVQEFEKKAIELRTDNPIYCFHPACSSFIPPEVVRGADIAQCPECFRGTCTHCKAQEHRGECQQDEGLQQLLETATGEGWQRCECGRVIELGVGCNHMTVSFTSSNTRTLRYGAFEALTDQIPSANADASSAISARLLGRRAVVHSGKKSDFLTELGRLLFVCPSSELLLL